MSSASTRPSASRTGTVSRLCDRRKAGEDRFARLVDAQRVRVVAVEAADGLRGCSCACFSSSRVLMLRNASASSSKLTSTTLSAAYQASILRPPEARKASRLLAHVAFHQRRTPDAAGRRSWRPPDRFLPASPSIGDQIRRQERRVARHGDDQRMRRGLESGMQAGERAGEAADLVGRRRDGRTPRRSSRFWLALITISSTCGVRRASTHSTIGLPRSGCRPLSTPPMRLPLPPASTMPVTFMAVPGNAKAARRARAGTWR